MESEVQVKFPRVKTLRTRMRENRIDNMISDIRWVERRDLKVLSIKKA